MSNSRFDDRQRQSGHLQALTLDDVHGLQVSPPQS
jgi:hypothetical protein